MTYLAKDEPEICDMCGEQVADCQCYNNENISEADYYDDFGDDENDEVIE